MKRRARMSMFSAVSAAALASAGCSRSVHVEPISTEPREMSMEQQARHVVNRLTFGARPGDYQRVLALGADRWIAEQLLPDKIPEDTALTAMLSRFETQTKPAAQILVDNPPPEELDRQLREQRRKMGDTGVFMMSADDSARRKQSADRANQLGAQLLAAKVARAQATNRQLQEMMTDFWENHFSTFIGKSPSRYAIVAYENDVIRPNALGKFRDLLGAVAKSPMMLFYLDNWQSAADNEHLELQQWNDLAKARTRADSEKIRMRRRRTGLNENYGRELLELHTLGVDGGYTQRDVIEVARALTGWTIQDPQKGGGFIFRPEWHDAMPKVVLGHRLKAGRGMEDGEEVLDIVARSEATARFIATKLVRRFVSDSPPPALVERAARTFRDSDGDIRATLRTIIGSSEFFARGDFRAKVKSPFELVVSAARALDAPIDTTPRLAQQIARLGQPIYGKLTPNGYPDAGDAWVNAGSVLNRINFGLAIATGRVAGIKLASWPPAAALNGAPIAIQVDSVVAEILSGEASPDTREILIAGENPLLRRAPADSMAMAGMAGSQRPPAPRTALANLVGLALGAPEFQRR
ncbi:MAG: DUF1800 domain-containing protein [Gemmatimonadota bacterium]|nr:DUF1800 domain-containing protein [Gemmatimonadota bacterium]